MLGCFVKQFFNYYFFTTQILGAVAADLLYKSMLGLCLIISRAASYLPKLALNNIPALCVYYDLHGSSFSKIMGQMKRKELEFFLSITKLSNQGQRV